MNRRQFTRHAISLSALMHPQQGRSWLCSVRDFCEHGMLLSGMGRSLDMSLGNPEGEEVALHFSVATPSGHEHFRTVARIARVLDSGNGVGVVFADGLDERAFDALLKFAVASGSAVIEEDDTVDAEGDAFLDGAAGFDQVADDEGDAQDARGEAHRVGADDDSMLSRSADATVSDPQKSSSQPRSPAAADIKAQKPPATRDKPGTIEQALRDRRISAQAGEQVRAKISDLAGVFVGNLGERFFDAVLDALLIKARDAGTNSIQVMYFEGLDQLEKGQEQICAYLKSEVDRQVKNITDLEEVLEKRKRRETGSSKKLELVDTEQFEDWLAVAELISKTENRHRDTLFDLRAQMGLIAKPWSHKDANPIGPAVLGWAFDDSLKNLDFSRQVKLDIYKAFEETLIAMLGRFYQEVNALFAESGDFPSLAELRNKLKERTVVRSRSGSALNPRAYQEMDSSLREATMAADGAVSRAGRVDHNPFVEPSQGHMYDSAREILGLTRQTRLLTGGHVEEMLAPPQAADHQTFSSDEIVAAISSVEQELGDAPLSDTRLKSRLFETLRQRHGAGKGFREQDFDNLQVMESLIDAIRVDRFLTDGIREWVQRLETTLNKLAARDPGFLNQDSHEPHSAVMMLNQLARLGNSRDVREGVDREVGRQVDELLQRVVQNYDKNPSIFAEAVSELNPLIDKQSRVYRGNIERTVRASEGQQKLARARRDVLQQMVPRLADRDVPDLLLEMLNPGWRNLLVHAHLRHGVTSNEWRDGLGLVDQVHDQLTGDIDKDNEAFVEPEALLKRVIDGLNGISFDPSKRTPLIMRLAESLIGDTGGARPPLRMTHVASDGVAAALGLDGLLPELDPSIESEDEDVRSSWANAVERARRVRVGEWLATSDAQGRPLILTVAFVGDHFSSFVLVNRKGIKTRELELKELADGLFEGRITLLDDYDIPLMDRASQRMLENMHNQLAFQATHDDLTGLMNRKEFERTIERSLAVARVESVQHALLYQDIDQFKVINNTSGHTAGDELLRGFGEIIERQLTGCDIEVARLGGDEFGVLLRNVKTPDARTLADKVLKGVRAEQFTWEGRKYNLSVSMGLVFVDRTTDSVDELMQFADEACYTAKDAGRNRLQEYEPGDTEMMQRHGVMEWVTQLDRALEEDRLILNCQRIVPLNDKTTTHLDTHYEILLTMRDELGDIMPPTDFINAAETYQRISFIDRWVIEQVLTWMAANRESLDRFGGFSINVSGHSINDETFADFVLEQFTRTQAPTSKVCFEITETATIANLDNAIDFMNRMKIIGCRFSLDDFGTGLSSYSYLRSLPVDYVKIDGVFVKDIATNPSDFAVVKSINEIGHYMGKQTIAEYVETSEILNSLKEIGVDFAQGYQVGKPHVLSELGVRLRAANSR